MEEHRDLSFLRVKSIFYKFCFYTKCPAPCNIFKLSGQSVLTDDKACLWCCGLSCALKPAVDKVVNSGQMQGKTTQAHVHTDTCARSECSSSAGSDFLQRERIQ